MAKHISLYLSDKEAQTLVHAVDARAYLLLQLGKKEEAEDMEELVRLLEMQIADPNNQ